MGAIIGGGSDAQIELMGAYFEAIGVAFQIIDDVLNLRGLPGKTKGEDLMAGKITHPVAKAMQRLDKPARAALWETIKSHTTDVAIIDGAIAVIEDCGALRDSEAEAVAMVTAAWAKLQSSMPDSFYSMLMRAFGLFVIQRHY
jgi:geranylgeranyl pyrophosphate synthase